MALLATVKEFLSRLVVKPVKRSIEMRKDRKRVTDLLSLNDDLLRDIGMTRVDIRRAIRSHDVFPSQSLAASVRARSQEWMRTETREAEKPSIIFRQAA